jgi:hypothetical protein
LASGLVVHGCVFPMMFPYIVQYEL